MTGKIVQVVGPVVDIKFPPNGLPAIYNAIKIDGVVGNGQEVHLTTEVMQHIGNDVVRSVAMSSTDGLVRGMEAVDTGAPIRVPVGPGTLGRIFNVLGETVDHDDTPVEADEKVFFRVVAAAFSVRRKMLSNSLKNMGGLAGEQVTQWLQKAGIDGKRRAETLSLQEFAQLASAWIEICNRKENEK